LLPSSVYHLDMEKTDFHLDEVDVEGRHDIRRAESVPVVHEHTPRSIAGLISSPVRSLASTLRSRSQVSRYYYSADVYSTVRHILRSSAPFLFATILSLRPRYMRIGGLRPASKTYPTTYLDSLRGWAAVVVLNCHYQPYKNASFMSLPIVGIVVNGGGMVDVFFVISGYVLSYRMIKLIRSQQAVSLLDAVASSVFRRYIRLYGSAAVAAFFSMLLVEFKLANLNLRQNTLHSQLWDWLTEFARFSNVFANVEGYWHRHVLTNKYLTLIWSLPVEFRGSIIVFTFCIGACKLSNRNRMLLCWALVVSAFYWAVPYVALFLGGLFLADLSFTWHPERLAAPASSTHEGGVIQTLPPRRQLLAEKVFFSAVLICALLLLGSSNNTELLRNAWPWPFLNSLTPKDYLGSDLQLHWWSSIGALLLVWALDFYPTLQTPLNWDFSRYLGDISFGIYLMHFPVLWVFSENIMNPLRLALLGNGSWTHAPGLLLNFGVVLWAADLFTRVDNRVVELGKWTQGKLFIW
jgi:peptidoglycan/LPS O-acetylase OafA/YrhL